VGADRKTQHSLWADCSKILKSPYAATSAYDRPISDIGIGTRNKRGPAWKLHIRALQGSRVARQFIGTFANPCRAMEINCRKFPGHGVT
jgi:hypothetical protein